MTKKVDNKRPMAAGDRVKIIGTNQQADVLSGPNRKGEFQVAIGPFTAWVNLDQLKPLSSKAQWEANYRLSQSSARSSSPGPQRVDLHGLSCELAVQALEIALDKALLDRTDCLLVIHGRGTGKVKEAVHFYLGACKYVSRFELDEKNRGITVVYL